MKCSHYRECTFTRRVVSLHIVNVQLCEHQDGKYHHLGEVSPSNSKPSARVLRGSALGQGEM